VTRTLHIGHLGALLVGLSVGCAPPPKPGELVALERLHKDATWRQVRREHRDLALQYSKAHRQALGAWEDGDLELARHWAHLALIRGRAAVATVAEQAEQGQRERLERELGDLLEKQHGLDQQLRVVGEMVDLYEELAVAQTNTRERDLHLSEVEQRAAAQKKVSDAQLALKTADTVDASRHAPGPYKMAQALLDKATAALAAEKPADGTAAAEMASEKAQAAYEAARPLYLKEQAAAARHTQNQALQQDAAAIAASVRGMSVKLHATGQTQQLVIQTTFLFRPKATRPYPKKREILSRIGELLQRHPGYPVVINGYTSHLSPEKERREISRARAQWVADHFRSLGVSPKRFVVAGRGAAKLIGYRLSGVNDRVEIILLFQ
jgi:outer membrane protein OmpA-like peptidoglycan-associated protein